MSFAQHHGGDITATFPNIYTYVGSPGGSVAKNPPAREETRVQPNFKSTGSKRVGHDLVTEHAHTHTRTHTHTHTHWVGQNVGLGFSIILQTFLPTQYIYTYIVVVIV